jgi:hypothetical protein
MKKTSRNMPSTTENKKDKSGTAGKSVCTCEHDHMKVNCKKCGKTIKVPSESPPNEYGYGCWECFEKDETENIDDKFMDFDWKNHMKVDCCFCLKTISVKKESPPNKAGYVCYECFKRGA